MNKQANTAQAAKRLSEQELSDIDAYWRAANYLTIGQIYLLDNPLLREPLRLEQRRCQELGEAAANDATCLRVWAESRDRFLGRSPAPEAPASNEGR